MDALNDFLIPLAIAVITAVVTAVVTIQIKYSATMDEAYRGLKSLAAKTLYYIWLAIVVINLFSLVASDKPLTRADVFGISVSTVCLALLVMFYFLERVLSLIKSIVENSRTQTELYERHIQIHHPDEIVGSNQGPNN